MWVILIGLVLVASGVAGCLWTEKRKFYRVNDAGVQEFASYGDSLKARTVEGLVKLVASFAVVIGLGFIIFKLF